MPIILNVPLNLWKNDTIQISLLGVKPIVTLCAHSYTPLNL